MSRAALIDKNGNVINVIVADAAKDPPIPGFSLVDVAKDQPCDQSFKYAGGTFADTKPAAPAAVASSGNVSVSQ